MKKSTKRCFGVKGFDYPTELLKDVQKSVAQIRDSKGIEYSKAKKLVFSKLIGNGIAN